jgi:hypothetical protein
MSEMPGLLEAITCTVLTHRADPSAIRHLHPSDLDWREKLGETALGTAQSESRSRLLLRIEVGNSLRWSIVQKFLECIIL